MENSIPSYLKLSLFNVACGGASPLNPYVDPILREVTGLTIPRLGMTLRKSTLLLLNSSVFPFDPVRLA